MSLWNDDEMCLRQEEQFEKSIKGKILNNIHKYLIKPIIFLFAIILCLSIILLPIGLFILDEAFNVSFISLD